MKDLFTYILIFMAGIHSDVYSQTQVPSNFNYTVREEEGELNNDNHNDKVVVDMDVKDIKRPFRLQVFLSHPNTKQLKLAVSTTKLIESMYPENKNGEHNGSTIPDFFIEKGLLQMVTDNSNYKSQYSFQFRNGNFELINIIRVNSRDENTTARTEIDLLKRTKTRFEQKLGSDQIINKSKTTLKLTKLPKIQELSFSDLEKY